MKRKVVFVGFEKRRVECLSPDLKGWKRKYELIFSQYVDDALETIALMKREDDIRGLIFHRNVLMTSPTKCKIMVDFANLHQERNFYPDRQVCAINLMSGEKDKGVLDHAVSETFAQENDWIQVKKFLDSKTGIYKNGCSSRYFRRSFFIVRKNNGLYLLFIYKSDVKKHKQTMKTNKQIQTALIKNYLFNRKFQRIFPIVTIVVLVLFVVGWQYNAPDKYEWQDVFAKAIGVATICTYMFAFFWQTETDLGNVYNELLHKVRTNEEKIENIQAFISQDNYTEEDLKNLLRIKKLEKKNIKLQWEIDLMTSK